MSVETESHLEESLVFRLKDSGWDPVSIRTEADLWANLRHELGAQNGVTFSDQEFARVRGHLSKGGPFEKAATLRDRMALTRDDGSTVRIRFFNSDEWCRNRFQVATQISIDGRRRNRYDVTLLVNGLPLGQIELKRRGTEIGEAFNQVNRYQRDSFGAAGGIFQFVQIFMISNGVNTRYYANNRDQSFNFTFTWSGPDNVPINRLSDFADTFLERCHFAKMIAKYVVRHETDRVMMILRPYQFHAAEAILNKVMNGRENGYVWHTTGSGKTLTSFKAAQNLTALPKVKKVIFVVDRADLDHQTQTEFNHFRPGSVDPTDDTRGLITHLTGVDSTLVLTTIQKLNAAITRDRFSGKLDDMRNGRIVFIFDECHRSQFGETHDRIKAFFSNAQMFGFTGTPILAENAVAGKTTESLFGKALHTYVISDAIRDGNVLPFSVEYVREDPPEAEVTGDAKRDRKNRNDLQKALSSQAYFEDPERVEAIAGWVIGNHDRKTCGREFAAIMAVGSVDALISYREAFERRRLRGEHDLRVAAIFTYAANEEDPDANGLIPETRFPDGQPSPESLPRRDRLQEFVEGYNACYGTNESVLDGRGFYAYNQAIGKRMKSRDRKGFLSSEGIDILLVVNMFLTGFDAKTINTIYVDKNLRWHGLIQAFSRTNRVLNVRKSHGNVVCFRDMKARTDEAVTLFANRDALSVVVTPGYEERLDEFRKAAAALFDIARNADEVDALRTEHDLERFAKAFRDVIRVRSALETYSQFSTSDLPIREQDYADLKSKYLDLGLRSSSAAAQEESRPLIEMNFELDLIRRDEINVTYILDLLSRMGLSARSNARERERVREEILGLLRSEVTLRGKAPLIREFMDEVLPALPEGADVREAFASFWAAKRAEAVIALTGEDGLDPEKLDSILSRIAFDGKRPFDDVMADALRKRPPLLQRRAIVERMIGSVLAIIETFDDGVGEIIRI